jgi:hypothetical protein
MPRKPTLKWTPKNSKKPGWYWFRSGTRMRILEVFDPWKKGALKAWDFQKGRFQMCTVAHYEGEWYGPLAT